MEYLLQVSMVVLRLSQLEKVTVKNLQCYSERMVKHLDWFLEKLTVVYRSSLKTVYFR